MQTGKLQRCCTLPREPRLTKISDPATAPKLLCNHGVYTNVHYYCALSKFIVCVAASLMTASFHVTIQEELSAAIVRIRQSVRTATGLYDGPVRRKAQRRHLRRRSRRVIFRTKVGPYRCTRPFGVVTFPLVEHQECRQPLRPARGVGTGMIVPVMLLRPPRLTHRLSVRRTSRKQPPRPSQIPLQKPPKHQLKRHKPGPRPRRQLQQKPEPEPERKLQRHKGTKPKAELQRQKSKAGMQRSRPGRRSQGRPDAPSKFAAGGVRKS